MRSALEQLVRLAIEYDYRNVDEFADYIARKLTKSIAYQRQVSEAEPHASPD